MELLLKSVNLIQFQLQHKIWTQGDAHVTGLKKFPTYFYTMVNHQAIFVCSNFPLGCVKLQRFVTYIISINIAQWFKCAVLRLPTYSQSIPNSNCQKANLIKPCDSDYLFHVCIRQALCNVMPMRVYNFKENHSRLHNWV